MLDTQSRWMNLRRIDGVGATGKHLRRSDQGKRREQYRLSVGEGFACLPRGEGEACAGGSMTTVPGIVELHGAPPTIGNSMEGGCIGKGDRNATNQACNG
jgi:hypothetical protein